MKLLIVTVIALFVNAILADQRQELIQKGEEILPKMQKTIQLLENEHRKTEAERLKKDVPFLKKLINDLKNLKDESKLQNLEMELKLLEEKVLIMIRLANLNLPIQREILINRAQMLITNATETINYLKAHNRKKESKSISEDVDQLKKFVQMIKNEDDMSKLLEIEMRLIVLEHHLSNKIFQIIHRNDVEASDHNRDMMVKNLLNKVQKLHEQIENEIKKINDEFYSRFTYNLVKIAKRVADLEDKIKAITNETKEHDIEQMRSTYVHLRNQYHMERNGLMKTFHQVEDLEKKADELRKQIQKDLKILKEKNMNVEAEELQVSADRLEVLAKDLKKQTHMDSLCYVAMLLRSIEWEVSAQLHLLERKINDH